MEEKEGGKWEIGKREWEKGRNRKEEMEWEKGRGGKGARTERGGRKR